MFSFPEQYAGYGWPARSVTVPPGSIPYGKSVEVLDGPGGYGPLVDTYARIRLTVVGLQLGAALKRDLAKLGRLYILVFAHHSKAESGA